ncbi:uncharacterized protein [Procambarus clarkii]|uniref:uncharacterized protein n=1 Tax=Procambarus clarkii TaxID=6728 RepID=UPI003742A953
MAVTSLLLLLAASVSAGLLHVPIHDDDDLTPGAMAGVLDAVLSSDEHPRCSVFFITDAASSHPAVTHLIKVLRVGGGVGVFMTTAVALDGNGTRWQLPQLLHHARKVRQESWCVTVVVVSDDLAFLNAFAQSSLHDHLLVGSTRLLVVTRLRLHQLQLLHRLLFITNSMLLITEESLHGFRLPAMGENK